MVMYVCEDGSTNTRYVLSLTVDNLGGNEEEPP